MNAEDLVKQAYASVGRTGIGSAPTNIDQEGFEYWVNEVESGRISPDALNQSFTNSVDQYIEDNDDAYTETMLDAIVNREYDRIGRSPEGEGVSAIDEEGKEYWKNELREGRVNVEDLDDAFDNAVTEYLQDNPDDEYSQYVGRQRSDLAEAAGITVGYTPEEQARYDQANSLYTLMFSRPLKEEGADYWVRGGGAGVPLTYQQILESAGAEDKERFEANVRQQVLDQYAGVGRTGFGTAPNQIDQEGYDYFVDQLLSGQVTLNDLPAVFRSSVDEYIAENPDDEYSKTMEDYLSQPRESATGTIVAGQPQVGEVGVVEYMGLQAGEPTLPVGTKLTGDLAQLEATDETLQALTPEQQLATDANYVATPQDITASTVTAPTPTDAVTATASTTDLVEQPEAAQMTAEKSLEQINAEADALQAARQDLNEIDPKATVQGQLALLQEQFADGEVPVWASGAFRQVNALMAQRGLGGSTIAAEAITNALMQSALPIAQQDASFYQNVTIQNLSNEQQAEMAKFNARTSAIFNDQAAENAARSLNTQSENELSQFFAQLAQNVSLANTQQVNAMEQFNATAENQATQFFAELGLTADTFNADAINELATFDAEQANIIAQFNANMKNQREQFNIQNQLAIDASNVQWRRDVNTQNTAATNAALQFDAQNLLAVQQTALNNIWQHYDTLLSYAFTAEESSKERALNLTISSMNAEMQRQIAEDSSFLESITGIVSGGATLLGSESGFKIAESWGLV